MPGVADLGVFQETGQPELLVSIDRGASARYGLMAADVNAAVQAAIGGLAATQILAGRPPLRFCDSLPAGISPDAGSDPQYPAADAGRQQRSARARWRTFRCTKARS